MRISGEKYTQKPHRTPASSNVMCLRCLLNNGLKTKISINYHLIKTGEKYKLNLKLVLDTFVTIHRPCLKHLYL